VFGPDALFADRFGTPEMFEIFSDRRMVQGWLDAEVALACSEAALGLIPDEAAQIIRSKADASQFDIETLREGIATTDHPLVSTVWKFAEACGEEAGRYVHWGATTQDIMDTGLVLQLRDALFVVGSRLDAVMGCAAALAESERATVMAGRTHGQQALPITFGLKAGNWLDELLRHDLRMRQLRARLLVGQLGGAAGTLAALGPNGLAVQRGFCEYLGLGVPVVAWHTARDSLAELASVLSMIAATCSRVAGEVVQLQRTEIAELEERQDAGNVGSSTMPHKRNPMTAEGIIATERLVRRSVDTALGGMSGEHERDMSKWQSEWLWIPELLVLVDSTLARTKEVLSGLRVRPDRMIENLGLTEGLLMSEAVMIALGEQLGRQRAHDLLHEMAMEVAEGDQSFESTLLASPAVLDAVGGPDRLKELLDPAGYLGATDEMIDDVLRRYRARPDDA
jgi:3-carboxy-cis,cis-muconate cycloisomerase